MLQLNQTTAFILLLCVACFWAGHAAAAAEPAGKRPGKQQPEPEQQQRPVAWAWISQQPQLSSIAGILTLIGADKQLSGPFTGTLLLPTNEVSCAPAGVGTAAEVSPHSKIGC